MSERQKASERIGETLTSTMAEFKELHRRNPKPSEADSATILAVGAVIADEIQEGVEQLRRIADAIERAGPGWYDVRTASGMIRGDIPLPHDSEDQ